MSSFPTSIVTPTDPTSGNLLNNPSHSQEHQSHNAEIVAVETKIGTGSSTPSTGKVLRATGTGTSSWSQVDVTTDVASFTSANLRTLLSDESGTGAAVFATSPAIATPTITSPLVVSSINDSSGNEIIRTPATGSAVNDLTITNAATGNKPKISSTGDDSNIGMDIQTKGSGTLTIVDGNGNEIIKTAIIASAVNEFTIQNAATATHPQIQATGNDSNINVNLVPKGSGNVTKGGNNIDWYEELGRTTLVGAGNTITVSSFTAKKYLKVLLFTTATGGNTIHNITFNSDTGTNYSRNLSTAGAADSTSVSQANFSFGFSASATPKFGEFEIINVLANEKLIIGHMLDQNTAGGGTAVIREEQTGKWANTSAQITTITCTNTSTGNYAIGSELVVLGHN